MVKSSMFLMSVISMGLILATPANASSKEKTKQTSIWDFAVYDYNTYMRRQLKKEDKERQQKKDRAQSRRANQQAESHFIKHDTSKVHGPITYR